MAAHRTIHILVVDDDDDFRNMIEKELRHMGFETACASGGKDAQTQIANGDIDVVLLDIKMPDMDGVTLLKEIKTRTPSPEVIMLTGHGTVENAIESMKLGAYEYLTKPCQLEELEVTLHKAYEKQALIKQNAALRQELARREPFPDLVGRSPALRPVLVLIEKVAATDSTVLIQGESGVGKELVARATHRHSLRADHPFVIIDCTSLQEDLLESELFGHEPGAYTGAVGLKHGLFEAADRGTVFMDEIGELTLSIQAKLLRVLETGTFRRVGGTRNIQVDARLITATNRRLEQMVEEGTFRKELYYRLNVISIMIPPLRERKEDIPLLARYFAENSEVTGSGSKGISEEAMEILIAYDWPGNVRELENVIERAVILSEGAVIGARDLPPNLRALGDPWMEGEGKWVPLKEVERRYIGRVLQEVGGHRGKAARILGVSERNLYRKLKRYGLQAG